MEIAISMKKGNSEKQVITICERALAVKQEMNERMCVVTSHTVTISPYHKNT